MIMKWMALGALTAAAAWGQAVDGAEVFQQSCASGYCHNGRGVGGGAPRLAARGLTQDYIAGRVRNGVPGTSMPSFAASLSPIEVNAVIAYVAGLNGIVAAPGAGAAGQGGAGRVRLSVEQVEGRDLFKDPVRGFKRCSTCHEAGGFGIAVAAPMGRVPASVPALKAVTTPQVATVTAAGDTMPALIVAKKANEVKFYDLTTPPPVLRTVAPEAFASRDGSSWSHADAIASYSDRELGAILVFLRAVLP